MFAVKAKYHHGEIIWLEPPPLTGNYDVIVVFASTEKSVAVSSAEKNRCLEILREYYSKDIPPDISLVDKLIAELRLEAARE